MLLLLLLRERQLLGPAPTVFAVSCLAYAALRLMPRAAMQMHGKLLLGRPPAVEAIDSVALG